MINYLIKMSFEQDLIDEISKFRTNPRGYTNIIKKYIMF